MESKAHDPTVHHEESDVDIRGILGFAAGLLVVAIVVHIAMWGLFRYFEASAAHHEEQPTYPLAAKQEQRLPPEPRLQTNPRQDLADLRAAEDQTLTTYGWVDRNAGVVRIPVEEAMKLAIQRGLPARSNK